MKRVTLGRFAFQYRAKAEWEASQLILYAGELAVEGDTGLMKVGDGKHLYSELPYFNRGEKGDTGEKGEKGETGAAIAIKGTKNSTADLPKTGQAGDAYMIGGDLYVWSDTTWTNVGRVKGEKGEKGEPGQKGDPPKMTISDAGTWVVEGVDTGKQAMGPKGERGDPGVEGKRGLPMRYDDLTSEQKQEMANMVSLDLTPYAKKAEVVTSVNGKKGDTMVGFFVGDDTRDLNYAPKDYLEHGVRFKGSTSSQFEFKRCTAVGVSRLIDQTYCILNTQVPWANASGGLPMQVAYGKGVIATRAGIDDDTWGKWQKVTTTNDLTDFAKRTDIKTRLADMTEDNEHRTVTDEEKKAWNKKVDAVAGKGLSTNDLTDALLQKLSNVKEQVILTQAEYDKLPTDQQNDGSKIYFIKA